MESPMLKKILAAAVLLALAYTAYTIINCSMPQKTKAKAARGPVKAASMLADSYRKSVKTQQAVKQDLDTKATLDLYSPEKKMMKDLGPQGMVQMMTQNQSRTRKPRVADT